MKESPLIQALLQKIVTWVRHQSELAVKTGRPLDAAEQMIAASVGVQCPENVRLVVGQPLPTLNSPVLTALAARQGVSTETAGGLTVGYGILIPDTNFSQRLLAHECRHVAQFESYPSLESYVTEYIDQLLRHGYLNAPLEIDARMHEHIR